MSHLIQVKVSAVCGISILDDDMNVVEEGLSRSKGQVFCVVGLSRNKDGVKSSHSLPLRQSPAGDYNGNCGIWPSTSTLNLEAKLDGKKKRYKTYEVSVMLTRGREQILIGVGSLKFANAVLDTEIDIPIHLIGTPSAKLITQNAKTNMKKKFFGKTKSKDSFFQSNSFETVNGIRTVRFNAGDNNRRYALDRGAFVRLKCSCLPKNGKIDIGQLESLLSSGRSSLDGPDSILSKPLMTMSTDTCISQKQASDTRGITALVNKCGAHQALLTTVSSDASSLKGGSFGRDSYSLHSGQEQPDVQSIKKQVEKLDEGLLAKLQRHFTCLNLSCYGHSDSHSVINDDYDAHYLQTLEQVPSLPSQVNFMVDYKESMKRNNDVNDLKLTKSTSTEITGRSSSEEIQKALSSEESCITEKLGSVLGVDLVELRDVTNEDSLVKHQHNQLQADYSFGNSTASSTSNFWDKLTALNQYEFKDDGNFSIATNSVSVDLR